MAACLFIGGGGDHNLTLLLKTLTIRCYVLCGNSSDSWNQVALLVEGCWLNYFCVFRFCSHKFQALPHASHIFPDFLAIPCAELVNAHSAFDPGAIASAAVYGALLGASVEESLRCRLECGHQAVVLSWADTAVEWRYNMAKKSKREIIFFNVEPSPWKLIDFSEMRLRSKDWKCHWHGSSTLHSLPRHPRRQGYQIRALPNISMACEICELCHHQVITMTTALCQT